MQCPFCFSYYGKYNQKLLLNCGHHICLACKQDLYNTANTQIACPSCQKQNREKPDLPPRLNKVNKQKEKCQQCDKNAFKVCEHCQNFLCQNHYQEEKYSICKTGHDYLMKGRSQRIEIQESHEQFHQTSDGKLLRYETLLAKIDEMLIYLQKIRLKAECEVEIIATDKKDIEMCFQKETEKVTTLITALEISLEGSQDLKDIWDTSNRMEEFLNSVNMSLPAVNNKTELSDYSNIEEAYLCLQDKDDDEESSLLQNANLTLVNVDGKPTDICVFDHIVNFSVIDGVVQQGNKGQPLPQPAIFLLLQHNELFVLNSNGDYQGEVQVQLQVTRNCLGLQSVCSWQEEEKLIISDCKNNCIHLTDLNGQGINRTKESVLKQPRGVCVFNKKVYCCDFLADSVVIFSLPSLHTLYTFKDQLSRPSYPVVTKNHLLITNCDAAGSVNIFSLLHNVFLESIPGFFKPSGITYSSLTDQLFVTDQHRVTELTMTNLKPKFSRGEFRTKGCENESFDIPCGIDIVTTSLGTRLFVCDLNNDRIKVFDIKLDLF